MKRMLILLWLSFVSLATSATMQMSDYLVYKGDTLPVYNDFFTGLHPPESSYSMLFWGHVRWESTANHRGYVAVWELIDNQLYLTEVYTYEYKESDKKADLKKAFGDRCVDGKVKADWFTGTAYAHVGEDLIYNDADMYIAYEKEIQMEFNQGVLGKTKWLDNSKAKKSRYYHDVSLLLTTIYSNIQWDKLPPLTDKDIRVMITFQSDESGGIDSVEVSRSYNEIYDREAVRVIKELKEWDVYFRHGKFDPQSYTIPVSFSKKMKELYCK